MLSNIHAYKIDEAGCIHIELEDGRQSYQSAGMFMTWMCTKMPTWRTLFNKSVAIVPIDKHFAKEYTIKDILHENGKEVFEELLFEFLHNLYFAKGEWFVEEEPADLQAEADAAWRERRNQ
jgi:hypothetical protein